MQSSPPAIARVLTWLGLSYLLVPLCLNEWVLMRVLPGISVVDPSGSRTLLALDVFFGLLGIATIAGRRRLVTAQLNLMIVVLLLFLLPVEAYLRTVEISGSELVEEDATLRVLDDRLHHSLAPLVEARSRWGDRIVTYRTNSLGFRDRATRVVSPKTDAQARLLVLGDSFAECIGIEYEDCFVLLLEKRLSQPGRAVEVLTGGVVSYSPRFDYRKLEAFLAGGYRTDQVVLMLDISDVHDEGVKYDGWEGHTEETRGKLEGGRERRLRAARAREARLGWIVRPRILGWIGGSRAEGDEKGEEEEPEYRVNPRFLWTERDDLAAEEWVARGIERCREYIVRTADLCRRERIAFTLVIYPHPTQLEGRRPSRFQTLIQELAEEHDIRLLDLFPAFRELEDWHDYFVPGDIHWNERGNELIAALLADELLPKDERQGSS